MLGPSRTIGWALAALALLAPGVWAQQASDDDPAVDMQEIVDAALAGEPRIAASTLELAKSRVDAWSVIDILLGYELDDPAGPAGPAAEAIDTIIEAVVGADGRLHALVRSWRAMDADARERDRDLRAALAEATTEGADAVEVLEREREAVDAATTSLTAIRLLAAAAEAHGDADRFDEGAALSLEALERAKALGWDRECSARMEHAALCSWSAGDGDTAAERFLRKREIDLERRDARAAAVAASDAGAACRMAGRADEALAHLDLAAAELLRIPGAEPEAAQAIGQMGLVEMDRGNRAAMFTHLERCLAIQEEAGADADAGITALNLGILRSRGGEWEAAIPGLEKAVRLLQATGNDGGMRTALDFRAQAYREVGRLDHAVADYGLLAASMHAAGDARGEATALTRRARIHHAAGEQAKARADLEAALGLFREAGDVASAGSVLGDLGAVLAALGDGEGAVARHREAIALFEELGDAGAVSLAYHNLASTLSDLGDPGAAAAAWEASLQDAGGPSVPTRWRRECLRGLAGARDALGQSGEAAAAWRTLGAIEREEGDVAAALVSERRAADSISDAGRLEEALAAFDAVLAVQVEAGAGREVLVTRTNRAVALQRAGELEAAERENRAVLAEVVETGDGELEAIVRGNLGVVAESRGRFAEALEHHEAALAAKRARDDGAGAAVTLNNLALVHRALGDLDRARALLEQAIAGKEAVGDDAGVATSLGNLALVQAESGDLDEAVALHRRVLALKRGFGRPGPVASSLNNLGLALLAAGRPDEAVERLEEALALREEMGDIVGIGSTRTNLGRVLREAGDDAAAREHYELAVERQREAANGPGEAAALRGLIGLELDAGRPAEALAAARRSLELRLAAASDLAGSEAEHLRGEVRLTTDFGLRALAALPDLDDRGAVAVELVERGRAALLADAVAHPDALLAAHLPLAVRERRAAARRRMQAARDALVGALTGADRSVAAIKAARAEVEAAAAGQRAATAEARRVARRAMGITEPRIASLEELRDALADGEALVLYQAGVDRLFAVTVTVAGARFHDLGPAAPVVGRAQRWLAAVESGDAEEEDAAVLHDALIAPLAADLEGATRLVVAPDGVLTFLPFDAMRGTVEGARRRLVRRFEITVVPSATLWRQLRSADEGGSGRGVIAVGDPVYPAERAGGGAPVAARRGAALRGWNRLPRLPATAEEARSVVARFPEDERVLLLREEATVDGLLGALRAAGPLRLLHLACHGFADPERPELSGLVLSGGEVLSVDRLHELDLSIDLVVLSACDTARGRVDRGEGVFNLARAFFVAGAGKVVVSNWKVDDQAAAALMEAFHRRLLEEGRPSSGALRSAKLERLDAGGPGAHPRYWAGWVLWGAAD